MEISPVDQVIKLWELFSKILNRRTSYPDGDHKILCVEVGKMQSKAGLLTFKIQEHRLIQPPKIDGEPTTKNSEDFFGENNFENFLSWLNELIIRYAPNGLAFSLGCPVYNNTPTTPQYWKWPENISKIFYDRFKISEILLLNDAVSFAFNCLSQKDLKKPILCLTLGGGIGCAVIRKERPCILAFEGGIISRKWPSGFEGDIHILAGEPFFKWFETEYKEKNLTNKELQEKKLYTDCIAWIIDSLGEKIEFQSVILGGGRVSYVQEDQLKKYFQDKEKSNRYRIIKKPGIKAALLGVGEAWIEYFVYPHSESLVQEQEPTIE